MMRSIGTQVNVNSGVKKAIEAEEARWRDFEAILRVAFAAREIAVAHFKDAECKEKLDKITRGGLNEG